MDGSITTIEIGNSINTPIPSRSEGLNSSFGIEETDLALWLRRLEEFAREFLKVKVNLSESFFIPQEIPWKSVIPIFDPGLDNRGMVNVLENFGFTVHQSPDVMKYSGSCRTRKPTLHLIGNSRVPDEETLGKSPRWLRRWYQSYDSILSLRGYGLAFALYHYVTRQILDARTFTWFPEDCLPGGLVARAEFFPANNGKVIDFYSRDADQSCPEGGVRLAISVPLR